MVALCRFHCIVEHAAEEDAGEEGKPADGTLKKRRGACIVKCIINLYNQIGFHPSYHQPLCSTILSLMCIDSVNDCCGVIRYI